MLGFVFAGGRREGSLIRAMRARGLGTPFGEASGAITERLTKLVSILNRAGLKAKAIGDMPDWLVTHAAMIAPLAIFILKHGCDTYALARSREDMGRLTDAMREALAVLRANGRRIVPHSTVLLDILPRFVVTNFFRALMSSRFGEIGAGTTFDPSGAVVPHATVMATNWKPGWFGRLKQPLKASIGLTTVLLQREMERGRFPLVSNSPLSGKVIVAPHDHWSQLSR
jgi:hypothetical protein